MKARIFNIMQYEKHPDTGETLLTEDTIKVALAHRTIKRWAYIAHDKDVYSALDELNDPSHVQGQVKPKHWHIVIEMGSNMAEVQTIAKWFGISPNFVDVAKGAGAFLDCVEYLTHEDEKQQELYGKSLYSDDLVVASFDFRAALLKRSSNRERFGRDLSDKEVMRMEVRQNGRSLLWCYNDNPVLYMDDMDKLKKLRLEYINSLPPPLVRINFYITGSGGAGKGLMSRAIARSLFPGLSDDEIFFEVGAKGSPFEGYDGQPVIIWNDRRAFDLLSELNGRGNVFNVFDTHPTRQRQNIKYSSINLCNQVNIVNSVQPFTDFLNGLAGSYKDSSGKSHNAEDAGQSYRRFPLIIPIHADDFDLLINKGFYEGSDDFAQYIAYNGIRGNFQRIAEVCGTNQDLRSTLELQTVAPIVENYNRLLSKVRSSDDLSDEQKQSILSEFASYGSYPCSASPDSDDEPDDIPRQLELSDIDSLFD